MATNKNLDKMTKAEAAKEVREARREAARAKAELARDKANNQLRGFMDFVREQGVVGLAIGLAIGAQAGATVKSIVEGFITPIVAFLVGSHDGLQEAKWYIVGRDTPQQNYWFTIDGRELVFAWGSVLSSLITLLAVAAVVYFVVKGLKLDKLDKKKS